MNNWLHFHILLLLLSSAGLRAQESGEEASERVKYSLIFPEEKTPELVKADENNPFETVAENGLNSEGDTEENQVRDMLLAMPVGGGVSGPNGLRVMLGGMRLEPGADVPPVIPDQQVRLRVHNISPSAIELVWVDKRPTGLPPKMLVIPMDGSPSVRYRMPSPGRGSSGGIGTIRKDGMTALAPPRDAPPAPPAPGPRWT
ncbi:MAG TPA: hypothetical protein PK490_07815 [Prosthecobacter sp.]|nr:hypothetical protein [Prosthecobacter sp.]